MLAQRGTGFEAISNRDEFTVGAVTNGDGVSGAGEDRDLSGLDNGTVLVVAECLENCEDGSFVGNVDLGALTFVCCIFDLEMLEVEDLLLGQLLRFRRIDEPDPHESIRHGVR